MSFGGNLRPLSPAPLSSLPAVLRMHEFCCSSESSISLHLAACALCQCQLVSCLLQDALDLIEFVTGPAESEWGSLRAKMGRPGPWHLNYFAIGNEVTHMLQRACVLYHSTLHITILHCHAPHAQVGCHSGHHLARLRPLFATVGASMAAWSLLLIMSGQDIFPSLKGHVSCLLHADHAAYNTLLVRFFICCWLSL